MIFTPPLHTHTHTNTWVKEKREKKVTDGMSTEWQPEGMLLVW